MWTYLSRYGTLLQDGDVIATGYSGHGEGRNNPALQFVKNTGPIPEGIYEMTLEPIGSHAPKLTDPVIRFTPIAGTDTKGRAGFLCHGDNTAHDASDGCMIFNHPTRMLMVSGILRKNPDNKLEVQAEVAQPAKAG